MTRDEQEKRRETIRKVYDETGKNGLKVEEIVSIFHISRGAVYGILGLNKKSKLDKIPKR